LGGDSVRSHRPSGHVGSSQIMDCESLSSGPTRWVSPPSGSLFPPPRVSFFFFCISIPVGADNDLLSFLSSRYKQFPKRRSPPFMRNSSFPEISCLPPVASFSCVWKNTPADEPTVHLSLNATGRRCDSATSFSRGVPAAALAALFLPYSRRDLLPLLRRLPPPFSLPTLSSHIRVPSSWVLLPGLSVF